MDNSQAVLSDCVLCLHAIQICIKRLLACSSSVNTVFPVTQPCQLESCDSIINRCHFDLTLERVMTLNSRVWHFKAVIAVLNVRAVDAPVSGEWINSLKVTVTFLREIPWAIFSLSLSHLRWRSRDLRKPSEFSVLEVNIFCPWGYSFNIFRLRGIG